MDMKSELAEGRGEPGLTTCLHCVRHFTQHSELEGAQNSLFMGYTVVSPRSNSIVEVLTLRPSECGYVWR